MGWCRGQAGREEGWSDGYSRVQMLKVGYKQGCKSRKARGPEISLLPNGRSNLFLSILQKKWFRYRNTRLDVFIPLRLWLFAPRPQAQSSSTPWDFHPQQGKEESLESEWPGTLPRATYPVGTIHMKGSTTDWGCWEWARFNNMLLNQIYFHVTTETVSLVSNSKRKLIKKSIYQALKFYPHLTKYCCTCFLCQHLHLQLIWVLQRKLMLKVIQEFRG